MPPACYERYLELAAAMPLYFENNELIAVHCFLLRVRALPDQPVDALTGDVNLDSNWKDQIILDRPLVAGHKRYSPNQCEPYIVEALNRSRRSF